MSRNDMYQQGITSS